MDCSTEGASVDDPCPKQISFFHWSSQNQALKVLFSIQVALKSARTQDLSKTGNKIQQVDKIIEILAHGEQDEEDFTRGKI